MEVTNESQASNQKSPLLSNKPKAKQSRWNNFWIACCIGQNLSDKEFKVSEFCKPIIFKTFLGTICMSLSSVVFGAVMQIGGGSNDFRILIGYAIAGAILGCVASVLVSYINELPGDKRFIKV